MEHCINCKWYSDNECRRFPPQVVYDTEKHLLVTQYPAIGISNCDACGEFKDKQ